MSILVSGSLVFDQIINFPDSLKNYIQTDSPHLLDVSFTVENIRKTFGGPGGNISYTLKMLGVDPLLVSSIGRDGKEYLAHLKKAGVNTKYVRVCGEKTASAYIFTDADDNQLAGVYQGDVKETEGVENVKGANKFSLAIISSSKKDVMQNDMLACKDLGIKTVFDPSHQILAFDETELRKLISMSFFIIGNDYEIQLLEKRSGWNTNEILQHAKVMVVTLGERGSIVRVAEGETIAAKACVPNSFDDPTGAGDAYRAGFFAGYEHGFNWKTCAQMGSVAAAYAIENQGTQGHTFTKEEFSKRYLAEYGENILL